MTIDSATNNFVGAVNVIGANITLVDANDLVLGNVTATGNLTICTDGSVEFTGATSVSGRHKGRQTQREADTKGQTQRDRHKTCVLR